MYTHHLALGNSTLPYARESCAKLAIRSASQDFFNKGNILAFWKNEKKFFLGCNKYVVDRIVGTIDNLDIFHVL